MMSKSTTYFGIIYIAITSSLQNSETNMSIYQNWKCLVADLTMYFKMCKISGQWGMYVAVFTVISSYINKFVSSLVTWYLVQELRSFMFQRLHLTIPEEYDITDRTHLITCIQIRKKYGKDIYMQRFHKIHR